MSGVPIETTGIYPNIIIRASAGTGKTFRLSNRYLKLLASGVECHEILATTFTKKGAGEILDRIVQRLARAALSPSHSATLAEELGIPLDQQRAKIILQPLLKGLHQLEISTLDSFFNRVARVFSLELGLPPTWEIVEEQQIDMLRRRTIRQMLRNEDVVTLLPLMNRGESSRKIATLVMGVVKSLYDVARESDDAAWDRLEELNTFLPREEIDQLKVFAASLPPDKRKNVTKQWEKVVPMLEAENWLAMSELNCFGYAIDGEPATGRSKFKPDYARVLLSLVPHVRAWITNRLIERNQATCRLLRIYGESLESTKSRLGQLRFDDVTERLVEFVKMWDTDQFSFRLDNQIQHLLLDEFQDTSPQQWSVIEPFARTVCRSNDPERSFFCVGDMKQAIFGWRGGVAEIFDLAERELDGLDADEPMTMSYRSSSKVIESVNGVFGKLDRFESNNAIATSAVHSWEEWFEPHSTVKGESFKGHVTVEYAADTDDSFSGDRFVRARIRNRNTQVATVERVRRLARELPKEMSIGVLTRTNKEVAELIFMLQQAGVHASEEGGNTLTDSAAVNLILSAITLADHPGDSCARFHVSHSPLGEHLEIPPETPDNQRETQRAASAAAARIREQLVHRGYGPTIESLARILAPDCTRRELTRLQHLVRIAFGSRSDSRRWAMRPIRFVEYVRDEIKIADQTSARVRVMTIHKSKGLEFDAVVVPHFHKNNEWIESFPAVIIGRPSPTDPIETVCRYINQHQRKLLPEWLQTLFDEGQRRTVREAMCVAYVAMTRAVHALHVVLSYSDKPNDNSFAGVLLSTLCEGAERKAGVIYENGDASWYQESASQQPASESDIDVSRYYQHHQAGEMFRPLSRETRSKRGVERIRPSWLEGGSKVKLADTLVSPDRERMLEFGSLLHACFEPIQWLDTPQQVSDLSRSSLVERLQKMVPGTAQVGRAVDRFFELLQQPNLRQLFSSVATREKFVVDPQSVLEVRTEQRLAVLLDPGSSVHADSIIQGTIDRLVIVREGTQAVAAEITDFKVDHINEDNLADRIKFYRPQIRAYREAIREMYGLADSQIATQLVFVQSGHVVQMDFFDNSVASDTDLKLPKSPPPGVRSEVKSASRPAPPKPAPRKPETAQSKSETVQSKSETAKRKPETVKRKPKKSDPSPGQKMFWTDDENGPIG